MLTDRPDMILDVYRGHKQQLSNNNNNCLLQLFYAFKYSRVMELRDTKFKVRGWPVGSCRRSNLWLVLAQHGIEPALIA